MSSTQFRFRYANHKKYFKYGLYENDTEFSKYVCSLKIDFEISWKGIKRAHPMADGNNPVCRLCMKETTAVVYALKDKYRENKKKWHIKNLW